MIIPKILMMMYKENGFTEDEAFEAEKKVYEANPVSKKERECAEEKQKQDGKRDFTRKRVIEQFNEKRRLPNIKPETGKEILPESKEGSEVEG